MKAAVQYGPGDVRVEEALEPYPKPDEVKVKVEYCGVCGTDFEIFQGRFGLMQTPEWPKGPKIEGHEASGTIVEIGSACRQGYQMGQRVAMNFRCACGACYYCRNKMEHFCTHVSIATGAFAEYAVYKESAVYVLPDEVSLEIGALLEPLSVVVHTIDLANIRPGSSVAISGGGTLGLLLLQLAVRAGAARVLVSEPQEEKRRLALAMGADVTVDPLSQDVLEAGKGLTEGRGFDTVIEASGNLGAARQALLMADKCGTVVWAAVYPVDAEVPVNPFYLYANELTIRAVNVSPYSFPRALQLLSKLDLQPIITSIEKLDDIVHVFNHQRSTANIKTLIKP